ncbi:hypothetical protein ES703_16578 [subsurface metagenome]
MEKLNKKIITQDEAFRLIERKLNNEYADLVSSNPGELKFVKFKLCFAIELGSVIGDIYFEEIGKLKKGWKVI